MARKVKEVKAVKEIKEEAKTDMFRPKKQKVADFVVVEYPREGEILMHPSYVIKLDASNGGYVQISIDGGEWSNCRFDGKSWYFDWANYPGGSRKIIARLCGHDGTEKIKTKVRKCTYKC